GSEIFANAVRHTSGPSTVTVRGTGSRLGIEVTDTSPGLPAPRGCTPHAESGRGLVLIAAMATEWGSTPTPTGKAVWFEMAPTTATAAEDKGDGPWQADAGKPMRPAHEHPFGLREAAPEACEAGQPR
ncbi:ATP-binding protein, partial [Streptomyces sp. WM4235]|uniref:ATP-binding protein n=1 Tax=Streptomyces sp. WM4235 TaxID=1415551 RepID=UPI000A47DF3A